jgi:hypothetical protein
MVLPSPVGESVAANFISKPFLPRFPQRVRRAFVLYLYLALESSNNFY